MSETAPDPAPAAAPRIPEIQVIHTNVGFGIQFRIELDKTLLALVTALFAFSVAFPPTLTAQSNRLLLALGWGALAMSMVGGIFELFGWECYFLTFRDYAKDRNIGDVVRRRITRWRRISRAAFFAGFLVGAVAIGIFTIDNLSQVRPPK